MAIPHPTLLPLLAALVLTSSAHAYTVTLGTPELQLAVDHYFPVTQEHPLGTLTLSEPMVVLRPGSRRIGMQLKVVAQVPSGPPIAGRGMVHGVLGYDAARRELQLRDPRLAGLTIDGVTEPFTGMITGMVDYLTQNQLPVIVVYRIDDETLKNAPQLKMLKSMEVRDGKVVVDLGW